MSLFYLRKMVLEFMLFVFAVLAVTFVGTVSVNSAIGILFSALLLSGFCLLTSGVFCQSMLLFFITFLWVSVVFFSSSSARSFARTNLHIICFVVLFLSLNGLLSSLSVVSVVFWFEVMLFSALTLMRITSKTERAGEALREMYLWGIVGSIQLVIGLVLFQVNDLVSSVFLLCGFAVKVPLWPFGSWLLRAHVEASTEFSIVLSGLLVKFGVIGVWRLFDFFAHSACRELALFLSFVGLIEASIRLLNQVDLKRIVALTTVIETNWLLICLSVGSSDLEAIGLALVFVHAATTSIEFSMVEFVYKLSGTRSVLAVGGLSASSPQLASIGWLTCLITIGLPGTSIFSMKFLFFTAFIKFNIILAFFLFIVFFLVLPVFFIRIWLLVLSGPAASRGLGNELTLAELAVVLVPIGWSIIIGFYPALILG